MCVAVLTVVVCLCYHMVVVSFGIVVGQSLQFNVLMETVRVVGFRH